MQHNFSLVASFLYFVPSFAWATKPQGGNPDTAGDPCAFLSILPKQPRNQCSMKSTGHFVPVAGATLQAPAPLSQTSCIDLLCPYFQPKLCPSAQPLWMNAWVRLSAWLPLRSSLNPGSAAKVSDLISPSLL